MGLCFVSCHSQKNTDVKQKVLWLMADQKRQRWKKAVECICAHSLSSLCHQECMIQPTSRARAAPLRLAYQKLCWTQCSVSRAACRALFPGLWQRTFWFSCELRLGLLEINACLVSHECPSCSCSPHCVSLSLCSNFHPVCQRRRVTCLCGNTVPSHGS